MFRKNLIEEICKGNDKKYKNQYCNHLSPPKSCRLLEGQKKLEIIFSEPEVRCKPKTKLLSYIDQLVTKFNDKISENDAQSIAFEAQKKIAKNWLKEEQNIHYLYSYIKKAARTATLDLMYMFSDFKPVCKNCIYLSPDRERKYVCTKKILTNGVVNELFEKKRKPSDKACKYGFEKIHIESNVEKLGIPEESGPHLFNSDKSVFKKLCQILMDRSPKSKKNNRQYLIFVRVCQLTTDDTKIVYKDLAKEFGVSKKSIERDIKEIYEYLKNYVSSNYVSFNDFISS